MAEGMEAEAWGKVRGSSYVREIVCVPGEVHGEQGKIVVELDALARSHSPRGVRVRHMIERDDVEEMITTPMLAGRSGRDTQEERGRGSGVFEQAQDVGGLDECSVVSRCLVLTQIKGYHGAHQRRALAGTIEQHVGTLSPRRFERSPPLSIRALEGLDGMLDIPKSVLSLLVVTTHTRDVDERERKEKPGPVVKDEDGIGRESQVEVLWEEDSDSEGDCAIDKPEEGCSLVGSVSEAPASAEGGEGSGAVGSCAGEGG